MIFLFSEYKWRNFNFRLAIYVLALSFIGVLVIKSAANGSMEDSRVTRQVLGIFVSIIVAGVLTLVDYHRILKISVLAYLTCIALLVWVLVNGVVRGGATRWVVVPVLGQLQPSEFTKIGLIVFFSWYFHKYQERINQVSILAATAVLFGLPVLLILI